MNMLNDLDWSNWLYGLWVAVVSAGASAAYGGVGAMAIAPEQFSVGSVKSIKLMALLFLWNGGKDFLLYLKQNPAPKIKTEKETQKVEYQQNPAAIVTTITKETKTEDLPR